MSPRDTFWFFAGVLAAVVVSLTTRAWLRPSITHAPATSGAQAGRAGLPALVLSVAAAFALIAVALGIYCVSGSPAAIAAAHAPDSAPSGIPTADNTPTDNTLLMPGDQSISMADAAAVAGAAKPDSATAGSLDEVTQKLARRLATSGGTDDEWRLLAQSYDYMGRTDDARAARTHKIATENSIDHKIR